MSTSGGNFAAGAARAIVVDTNILIAIEDHATAGHANGAAASRLSALAARNGMTLSIAQGTKSDFLRAEPEVKSKRLKQLDRYHLLGAVVPTSNQRVRFKVPEDSSANDQCDLEILCAIDNNAAELLVSEDKRLRKRAISGGLGERVLSLADAVAYLEALGGSL